MNWPIFAIFAYVFLVLEVGLGPLVRVGEYQPGFVFVLLVFISMVARPVPAMWAAFVLGLLLDLRGTSMATGGDSSVVIALVGPNALGCMAAAYVVLQLRSLVLANTPLTMAVLTFFGGVVWHLSVVALITLRDWTPVAPVANWQPADELVARFIALLYTVLVASVLNLPLRGTRWMLEAHADRRRMH